MTRLTPPSRTLCAGVLAVLLLASCDFFTPKNDPPKAPQKLATPTMNPNGGTFTTAKSVTLSGPSGADLYYTTNGSVPSAANGTLYSAPFTLSASATVKVIAVKSGSLDSAVASAVFTITILGTGEIAVTVQ